MSKKRIIPPVEFFSKLKWLDGTPLLNHIEPYRQKIFTQALYTFDENGDPQYNQVLCGRGKKNFKTCDLVLAAFYKLFGWQSYQGNDCFILANDRDQAKDDLTLAKKLIEVNPKLESHVKVQSNKIIRADERGVLEILPANDVKGSHGKTYLFCGWDEIHAYRNWDIFEALAPDPTRTDSLNWITSYDSLYNNKGAPLHDLKERGKAGDDPRFYFSWYSADYGTDKSFRELPTPEERANPSLKNFYEGYLTQQKLRLPTHKYRRLHLNLPGAPDGQFLDPDNVLKCIISGRKHRKPRLPDPNRYTEDFIRYEAFVDMSGGSNDDACLAIAHRCSETNRVILDFLDCQPGQSKPFNPRLAIKKFATVLQSYGLRKVTGDSYAGQTFVKDFEDHGVQYEKCSLSKSDLYHELEPLINAQEVELLDHNDLEFQLLTLVSKGSKIDHAPGDHDDFANAVAGATWLCKEADAYVGDIGEAIGGLTKASAWGSDDPFEDTPMAERSHAGGFRW